MPGDRSTEGNEPKMSNDEKSGYGLTLFISLFMLVPMALAFIFIYRKVSSNGPCLYYSAFFLIGIAPRLIRLLLKLLFGLESELHGNAEAGISLGPLVYGVIFYFPVELILFSALSMYLEQYPGCDFHFGWDAVLFLFLIVLVQAGMRMYQDAMDIPHQFHRLHHATYDRNKWILYDTTFAGHVKASTYCMQRGGKYWEVGIVLIERREKEHYKSEEYYLQSKSGFLFSPILLIKSSSEVQPPVIQYDRDQKGPLTLHFPDGGAVLVKHYSANRSFNRLVYYFRFRKFLRVPSGYRKGILPRPTFSIFCPVLVPKK